MRTQPDPNQVTHPLHVARQAALIGGAAAFPGFLVGATYGTLRTQTPVIFSLASGGQWFAIATTFWGVRTAILNQTGLLNWWNLTRGAPLHPRHDLNPSREDRVRASTISGAITGFSLGFLFRGPRNVIPGTIMFTLFGWGGQHAYNYLDKRNSDVIRKEQEMREQGEVKEQLNWLQRVAKSKWSPMSILTDEEYERMMNEKLLAVEAEIALIDEKIEGLRKKQNDMEAQKQKESTSLDKQ
ncbi:hypothetical protein BU26DRAFT_516867 [Trematosphaeria pertusa]|uniref:Uncharacterized protein n=1 Tax=Trematosphaeria pertusa TaxID=390896 RepID=A0A6A6IPJ5_9PLEO|nr:uncharacterized protein BU26DRAFT_516867 [Trematosphaeria pertusa]KAF2252179.1 hypothetical protein BU26DRAFT_516867 [Trematosphaeria pertusa]